MKFLVDAQLPRRLARWLNDIGHDAIHTLDLPNGNATPDAEIIARAADEQRIVVTKDDDFVQTFLLSGQPTMLWLVSTGNIGNKALEDLIRDNFSMVATAFESARFVELSRDALIVHE